MLSVWGAGPLTPVGRGRGAPHLVPAGAERGQGAPHPDACQPVAGPAGGHRFTAASMVSRRPGRACAPLGWPLCRYRRELKGARDARFARYAAA